MISVRDRARLNLAASALRVALFVVLLGGGLMTDQQQTMQYGSLTRLYEDVRDHRVDVIEYRFHVTEERYDLSVRWSTGLLSWWEFSDAGSAGGSPGPALKEFQEAFPDKYGERQTSDFESDLRRAIGNQKIDIRPYPDAGSHDMFWIRAIPGGWQGVTVWMVALALFGVMFTARDHRYANRWAWFWMFMAGPLGMLGYLWLEKRPFPPSLPPRARAPIGGFVGFCCSICIAFLFSGAIAFATWLA